MIREMHLRVSKHKLRSLSYLLRYLIFDPYSDKTFLTDMLFDEDTTLLSFFENFSDPEDEEELKENIIKYVGGGNFGGA